MAHWYAVRRAVHNIRILMETIFVDLNPDHLRKALVIAIQLIRNWHGLGMVGDLEATAWRIYWERSPEMEPLRDLFPDDPTSQPEASVG